MKREKIKISEEFIKNITEEGYTEGFEIISQEQQTHDVDDGNLVIFVLKRNSDGKFFKGDYNWWSNDQEFDDYSEELEEVFPEVITTTIYK